MMLGRAFARLTYANVISTVALFVALGGASYAAIKLPANSVGTKQLRRSAVTSTKVKDRSLLRRDFKAGQLPAGARGPAGATGPSGAAGSPGAAGPVGPSNAYASVRNSGPTGVGTSDTPVATLANLPAGSYTVIAKTELHSDSNTDVLCTLSAGGETDTAESFVGDGAGNAGAVFVDVLPLALTHTFDTTGQVLLSCRRDLAANVSVTQTKIIATKVGSVSSSAVTG
jgi:hypothetical protein